MLWLVILIPLFFTVRPTTGLPESGNKTLNLDRLDFFEHESGSRDPSPLPTTYEYEVEDDYGRSESYSYVIDAPDDDSAISKRDKPTGLTIRQTNARRELMFNSQAKGSNIFNLLDFAYIDYAGAGVTGGVTIYMHDSGIYLDHSEFKGKRPEGVLKPNVKRIIPEKSLKGNEFPQTKKDLNGHGTCVASKAIGLFYGVAKAASLKMVPWGDILNDDFMLTGLQAIIDDIDRKIKQKGSKGFFPIVNFSYHLGTHVNTNLELQNDYRKKYQTMVDKGALLVVAAGNNGPGSVEYFPARFAQEDSFIGNMIVVGGVDLVGKTWKDSVYGNLVHAWAPAIAEDDSDDVKRKYIACAGTANPTDVVLRSGTSLAAPQVAGLAAYLYSTSATLQGKGAAWKVRARILEKSYPRTRGGYACIWNLLAGTECRFK
ncbi:uncharacterized protein N7459_004607 [Penicillium hispanicum]|uniref:uncharacterized protein n=1 Tax=Penicillium hispanicum TaxID=1080232 RepID=UPI0025407D6B|nr:uncharacterized protein N7459_004607 [Penicillium hispanicum]KAJ5584807.1 hypothetical protein N7459_004607 [Penicillium hispanicum]